jgi:demethylmenaquinone methyltransferase / 2-methoxy-6-polyprenyl-1,4-benzoquinol methylase
MANKFYVQDGQRAAKVNDLFATIAGRYDLINDLQSFGLHRWWKRKLIRLANTRPGERALDLCCGTGDVAFALARRGMRVVGLDFSGPMLAVAAIRRERSEAGTRPPAGRMDDASLSSLRPPTAVTFLRGDAMAIPFADASFDVVTISYGLRNLAGVEQGLREMWRVTRPGGRILALDFGKPPNSFWRLLYFTYLKLFVPLFGRLFCGDADTYAYILESLKHYPAQEGVAAAMRELKCSNVRVHNLLGGVMSINSGEKPR